MKPTYTDYRLGIQHGKLGFAAQYPNNRDYLLGFAAGETIFAIWVKLIEPFTNELPSGTNDIDVTP